MSDECEYELNALCQKLIKVLTDHECLSKTRSVYKSFSHIIKKVKNLGYMTFDSFLTDVKIVFSNLKRLDNRPLGVEDAEQKFAEELNALISMDYYKSGNESDTSASDSALFKMKKKKTIKDKSPKSPKCGSKKKKLSKTPAKDDKSPTKGDRIKIKLKLTPNKMDSMSMTNFDFDVNSNKVQGLCAALLKAANVRVGVLKAFTHLPDKSILPDYYEIIQLPISLSMIKEAITKGMYTSVYHCYTDLIIMCVNAKTYNEPHTEIYDMSLEMSSAITKHLSSAIKMSDKCVRTAISPQYTLVDYTPDQKKINFNEDMFVDFWNMFSQVVSRCNKTGRPLSSVFLRLLDEAAFPLYYKEIKKPMSLCGIRSKIITCRYEHITDLIEDITTMCDNAIQFNTKSSVISKDATSLKDFVISLAQAYVKEEEENSPEMKCVKVGDKRKAVVSRLRVSSRDVETSSPPIKKEKAEKVLLKSPPKQAAVITEEAGTVESLVFSCFNELKNKGSEIQSELIRIYSAFHDKIDSIVDLEEVLETAKNCRKVLLMIVCAMSSRIDPLCPEFETIESVLVKLVKIDNDSKKLFECMPTYCYEGKKYLLQEELVMLFRHTPYGCILTHNSNVTRIAKKKKELRQVVTNLDVMSEDVILVDCDDVKRTLHTPLLDKLKKPITPKQEPKTPKSAMPPKLEYLGKSKTDSMKTPKSASSKARSNTPRSTDNIAKMPKPGSKKSTEVKAEVLEQTIDVKPTSKYLSIEMEQAKALIKSIKYFKNPSGKLDFEDFFAIPTSKSYHSVIKYPMSLDVIEKSLESGTMSTVEDVISSCLLIIQNARYYNEEKSDLHNRALQLQKVLFSQLIPEDSTETMVVANRVMMHLVEDLRRSTEIEGLTKADSNTKFVNMSFSQLCSNVEQGYYTRFDRFQDDLLHIIVSNMNTNQFNEIGTKLLRIFKYYLNIRDKMVSIKSKCFDLTMGMFEAHYKDRLDVDIPPAPITCLTYQNNSYMVGDKVQVVFSEEDEMILHINTVNSPCWLAGTVYFKMDDTLYKTDIKDIVHVKYVTNKITKRFRYLSFNYRTRVTSDIVTNKSSFCKESFLSFFTYLSLSRYNTQTVIHGMNDSKTYYLQYVRDNGDVFKVGDFVYLKSENELPYIARIDKIHRDKKSHVWVYGPWFIRPVDTKFYDTKAFHPNEVLMSNIADMNHINSVEGLCEILCSKDYTIKHPLSYLEKDVYICDTKYDESTHKFSKLTEAKLYLSESVGNLETSEWYIYPTPRRIFRTTKPPFLKPTLVDVDSSSEEEEENEEEEKDDDPDVHYSPAPPVVPKPPPTPSGGTTPSVPRHSCQYKQGGTPRLVRAPGSQVQATPRQTLEHRIVVNNTIALNNSSALGRVHTPIHSTTPRPKPSSSTSSPFVSSYTPQSHIVHPRKPVGPVKLCCRWGTSCQESFTDHNEYYKHVINIQTHLSRSNNPSWRCLWVGCTDREAKMEGCNTQILLRRHVMCHMSDSGYSQPAPAKRPKILRHSEAYKIFLNKLIVQKQAPEQANMEMTVLED